MIPTSNNDEDYYVAAVGDLYPTPNNPIEIESGVVYVWGWAYKLNGVEVALPRTRPLYANAVPVSVSNGDTLTLIVSYE